MAFERRPTATFALVATTANGGIWSRAELGPASSTPSDPTLPMRVLRQAPLSGDAWLPWMKKEEKESGWRERERECLGGEREGGTMGERE